jgi:hypothetical protein
MQNRTRRFTLALGITSLACTSASAWDGVPVRRVRAEVPVVTSRTTVGQPTDRVTPDGAHGSGSRGKGPPRVSVDRSSARRGAERKLKFGSHQARPGTAQSSRFGRPRGTTTERRPELSLMLRDARPRMIPPEKRSCFRSGIPSTVGSRPDERQALPPLSALLLAPVGRLLRESSP